MFKIEKSPELFEPGPYVGTLSGVKSGEAEDEVEIQITIPDHPSPLGRPFPRRVLPNSSEARELEIIFGTSALDKIDAEKAKGRRFPIFVSSRRGPGGKVQPVLGPVLSLDAMESVVLELKTAPTGTSA